MCRACARSNSSRGRGGNAVFINHDASRTSNYCYVCEIPPGKSLTPTRHLFEEIIFVLDGRGSTTVWNDQGQRVTFEWQPGTLIVPPNMWLHQHFNTGPTPARYLAFKVGSQRSAQGVMMCWISKRLGGDQLDYADESPRVREMFAEALARHGLKPRMEQAYARERETLPPLPRSKAAE
jgi:mannose-6-phosphate isomerase-like protein (cupin superfamily)